MDTPVSTLAPRSSFVLRSVAVAALLLALISTTVYAQGTRTANQEATPATSGDLLATAAAAPVDASAFVAINLDPASEQFQTSAELSETAGLTDLFTQLTMSGDADSEDATALFEGIGATELGFVVPAVSTDMLDEVSTTATDEMVAVEDQDFRVVLATTDPEAAFDFLTEQLPMMAATPVGSPQAAQEPEESDYAGVSIVTFPGDGSQGAGISLALVEDLIVISPVVEGIESSIDTVQGTNDSVATNSRFQDVTGQLSGDSMLFSYSDSAALFDDPAYSDLLMGLGIDPVWLTQSNVYGGMQVLADAAAPGFRVNTVSFPNTGSGPTPAATPEYSSDLTDRVPDTTMIYLGGNELGNMLGPVVSIAVAVALTSDVADDLDPESVGIAQGTPETTSPTTTDEETVPGNGTDGTSVGDVTGGATTKDLMGIANIVGSFLTLINGEYVVAIQAPDSVNLADPNSLFALFGTGVEGGALIDSLLDFATSAATGSSDETTVTTEVINGDPVYTVTTGEGASATRLSYGVVDGQLLVGLGDSVQTYVAGFDTTLADNPQFQQTFEALGRAPADGAVVYLDMTTLLPLVQSGSELLGSTGAVPDSDPACASYDTQEDAQTAYDEEPFDNSDLDLDFDGEACEDFFAPAGTPEPTLSDIDFSSVVSYGQVTYQGDGFTASEGLFLLTPAA